MPAGVAATPRHAAGGLLGGAFGPMPPHESEYSVALHWSWQVHGPPPTDGPPLLAHCVCIGSSAGHPKPSPFGSTHERYARVAPHPLADASGMATHTFEVTACAVSSALVPPPHPSTANATSAPTTAIRIIVTVYRVLPLVPRSPSRPRKRACTVTTCRKYTRTPVMAGVARTALWSTLRESSR